MNIISHYLSSACAQCLLVPQVISHSSLREEEEKKKRMNGQIITRIHNDTYTHTLWVSWWRRPEIKGTDPHSQRDHIWRCNLFKYKSHILCVDTHVVCVCVCFHQRMRSSLNSWFHCVYNVDIWIVFLEDDMNSCAIHAESIILLCTTVRFCKASELTQLHNTHSILRWMPPARQN